MCRASQTAAASLLALLVCPAWPVGAVAGGYPSVPYAMGGPGRVLTSDPANLWVAQPGVLQEVSDRPDGSLGVIRTIGLPDGTIPLDVQSGPDFLFVLDAARERLLAYPTAHMSGGSLGSPLELAVGSKPAALANGYAGAGSHSVAWVAVANSGSGDLSVYTWNDTSIGVVPQLSAERRVPVGGQPLTLTGLDANGSSVDRSLAIAGGSAGTVTIVDPEKDFARTAEISVGGSPSSISAPDLGGPRAPYGVPYADLLVGDASAPVVHVLLRAPTGLVPQAPLRLAGPNGTANLVAVGDLNDDSKPDVIVADRATKSLVVFDNRSGSRFASPRTLASGIDAVSLVVGDFGGDWQHLDIAVADALHNSVVRFLTAGDPLVVAGADAHNPSADGGLLAWSYVPRPGVHRLAVRQRGKAKDVPIGPSTQPFVPHVGRLAPGRPAIAYSACRRGHCSPRVWDVVAHRERPLHINVANSCGVAAVAVWDRARAYQVGNAENRTCPDKGGIWLRGPRGRPVRRGSGRLGDFRDGFAAWMAYWPEGHGEQIRFAGLHGRIRTMARISIDCHCWLEHPTITHGHLIYGVNNDDEDPGGIDLYRLRLRDRGACQETFASPTRMGIPVFDDHIDYTVDGNDIFYADNPPWGRAFGSRGIFAVEPARVRWRRDCSLPRG